MRTTYEADYMGPKQFGMHALHLTRNCENLEHVLNDVHGIWQVGQHERQAKAR